MLADLAGFAATPEFQKLPPPEDHLEIRHDQR
jgi:hypothetical protein